MNYSKKGNLHRAWMITGPTHNLLGIEFGSTPDNQCVVERLPSREGIEGPLRDDDVKAWVLAAVARANEELGTSLIVCRIQYVADDTPDPKAYTLLARELVSKAQ